MSVLTDSVAPVCATAFVVDCASSMSEIGDTQRHLTRLQMTQYAVDSTLKGIYNPLHYWACVSFAATASTRYPLTQNSSAIPAEISQLKTTGEANFTSALLQYVGGPLVLLASSPIGARRSIILISDGRTGQPIAVDSIIRNYLVNNIACYIISLDTAVGPELNRIAIKTGGYAVQANSLDELQRELSGIMHCMQAEQHIALQWRTDYACLLEPSTRSVTIKVQRDLVATETSDYQVLLSQYGSVVAKYDLLDFGDLGPGDSATQVLPIKVSGVPFALQGLRVEPAQFFKVVDSGQKTPGDTIKPGEEWEIKVSCTPDAVRTGRSAVLYIDGTPCSLEVHLLVDSSLFRIDSPTAYTTYSLCDTIDIQWTNADTNKSVDLWYTANSDSTQPEWHLIECNLHERQYHWHSPVATNAMRLRAGYGEMQWLKSFGSSTDETVANIVLDPNQSAVYIGGSFADTLFTNEAEIVSSGDRDAFVAKVDSAGGLQWMRPIGGSGADSLCGISVDSLGHVYACGRFSSPTMIMAADTLSRSTYDSSNIYLCSFAPDGTLIWAVCGGGGMVDTSNVEVDSISYKDGVVYLKGRFANILVMTSSGISGGSIKGVNGYSAMQAFTAAYSIDGNLLWISQDKSSRPYERSEITSTNGLSYTVGLYRGTYSAGAHIPELQSRGAKDIVLRSWKHDAVSNTVETSALVVQSAPWYCNWEIFETPAVKVGDSILAKLGFGLPVNNSGFDQEIIGARVLYHSDSLATVVSPSPGQIVHLYEHIPLELLIHPRTSGHFLIAVEIRTRCAADTVYISFTSYGASEVVDVGANDFKLYPNPCDAVLTLDFSETVSSRDVRLELFSLQGERVLSSVVQAYSQTKRCELDVSAVPNGVYYAHLYVGESIICRPVHIIH